MTELAVDNDKTKEVLDSLAAQSLANVELTESGIIVYSFYDVLHLGEKKNVQYKLRCRSIERTQNLCRAIREAAKRSPLRSHPGPSQYIQKESR